MIKAKHHSGIRFFFTQYINYILRKNFSHLYFVNEIPEIPKNRALLLTPNHMSWWDGFIIDYLNRKFLCKKFHVMMLEEQLKKYWFFKHLGAYSIEPKSKTSIDETFLYTGELLHHQENIVVLFPQGELFPFMRRPVDIKKGITHLNQYTHTNFIILPLFLTISFYNEKLPEIYVRFGDLMDNKTLDFNNYKNMFTDEINALSEAAAERNFIQDVL